MEKCDSLFTKCDFLEQYSRRNNVRVMGIDHCPQEKVEENVLKVLREKMSLQIDASHIDRCHQLKAAKNGSQSVIVKFVSHRHRRLVLRNRGKLKGTGIYVEELGLC